MREDSNTKDPYTSCGSDVREYLNGHFPRNYQLLACTLVLQMHNDRGHFVYYFCILISYNNLFHVFIHLLCLL